MESKQWQYRRPRPRRFDFPRRGTKSLTAEVAKAVIDRKVPAEAQLYCKLFEHWGDLVGPRMADRSCPALLRRHVLFVDLRDHQWAHDMRYMQKAILTRISALVGPRQVLSLRCRVLAPGNFLSFTQRQHRTQTRRQAWREMTWPTPKPPALARKAPERTEAILSTMEHKGIKAHAQAFRRALSKQEDD